MAGLALRVAVLAAILGADRISWRAVCEALAVKLILIRLILLAGSALSRAGSSAVQAICVAGLAPLLAIRVESLRTSLQAIEIVEILVVSR